MPTREDSSRQRIYLDNAATSWPKPESVYQAMDRHAREIGAPAGRSGYYHAVETGRIVDRARARVAKLIGAADPSSVVFCLNGTDALNVAIHGALRPGDHVVTSEAEHNSVLRPLADARQRLGVEVTYVGVDQQGYVSPDEVLSAVRPETRLVALTHASNVTGAVQPLEEVGRRLQELPPLFLVDAAQSLGHIPVSVSELHADLLAAPGHKGLLGPLGTGILYVGPDAADRVASFRQGGTGTSSEQEDHPLELPHKFEAGNLNVIGIAGLEAAVSYLLQEKGINEISEHEQALTRSLVERLAQLDGVVVHGPRGDRPRLGVVSITAQGYDPQDLAAMLDSAAGIQARAGLQCAPRMHRALGTLSAGGTLRFSLGHANGSEEIETAINVIRGFLGAA